MDTDSADFSNEACFDSEMEPNLDRAIESIKQGRKVTFREAQLNRAGNNMRRPLRQMKMDECLEEHLPVIFNKHATNEDKIKAIHTAMEEYRKSGRYFTEEEIEGIRSTAYEAGVQSSGGELQLDA